MKRPPVFAVTLRRGKRVFLCSCGHEHVHADLGDGLYLPQCPKGSPLRDTGYFLTVSRRKAKR